MTTKEALDIIELIRRYSNAGLYQSAAQLLRQFHPEGWQYETALKPLTPAQVEGIAAQSKLMDRPIWTVTPSGPVPTGKGVRFEEAYSDWWDQYESYNCGE